MKIGSPTLQNIGSDTQIILILQLELKSLGFFISVINDDNLGFSEGYDGLRIKCIMIDLNFSIPLKLCMEIFMLSSQK